MLCTILYTVQYCISDFVMRLCLWNWLFTAYFRLNSAFLTYHGNIKCCEVASFIIWAFGVTIWRTIVNVSWRERFRVTIVLDVTQSVGPHRRTDKKENCKKCSCATVLQTINGGVSWDCKSEWCGCIIQQWEPSQFASICRRRERIQRPRREWRETPSLRRRRRTVVLSWGCNTREWIANFHRTWRNRL